MRVCFLVMAVALSLPAAGQELPLPWEVWKDLGTVATIDPGVRAILASSAAPDGGPYDRHSEGDSRFARIVDGEGVIFETEGAGAVTRIWMTQGDGVSMDLDPAIRLRVRLDGAVEPVIDLSLREFFSGLISPFLSPMVLDRRHSGGGNISYVPVPFRNGCRVSLVGAANAKIWFQVSAMLLENADGVVSFTGDEDLAEWRRMLARPGTDPWAIELQTPNSIGETISGNVVLNPGDPQELAAFEGPDQITGIVLRVPRPRLGEVIIRMSFDGRKTVDLRLPWFFGVGSPTCLPVRSLLVGVDQGDAYSYFPMPFERQASIAVELSSDASSGLSLKYAVRRAGRRPRPGAGMFGAEVIDVAASAPGEDAILLDLSGPGRLAGLAMTARSTGDGGWTFLEGDETLAVDGELDASWRGTGVEDFFGGGFYFKNPEGRPTPFLQALHGMACVGRNRERPAVSVYRLMPIDGPVFENSLRLGQEGGPTGDVAVGWRGVAWLYRGSDRTRSD